MVYSVLLASYTTTVLNKVISHHLFDCLSRKNVKCWAMKRLLVLLILANCLPGLAASLSKTALDTWKDIVPTVAFKKGDDLSRQEGGTLWAEVQKHYPIKSNVSVFYIKHPCRDPHKKDAPLRLRDPQNYPSTRGSQGFVFLDEIEKTAHHTFTSLIPGY